MAKIYYKVTDLSDPYRKAHFVNEGRDAEAEIYEWVMKITHNNHDLAADMAAWAMEAPVGDNWTEDYVDISIEEE